MTLNNFGYAKVMVVDDSVLIRTLAVETIKSVLPDCAIMESQDGMEAIKQFAKFQPDVVFMDIDMPRVNGFIALNTIKRSQTKTKIIMMTADQSEEAREKAAHLGASGFITKPFDKDDVISTMSEL